MLFRPINDCEEVTSDMSQLAGCPVFRWPHWIFDRVVEASMEAVCRPAGGHGRRSESLAVLRLLFDLAAADMHDILQMYVGQVMKFSV